jgi:hypothetical protein
MSEYQYAAFRVIERAVSQKNLAYMRRHSSRAEIMPWSFEVLRPLNVTRG